MHCRVLPVAGALRVLPGAVAALSLLLRPQRRSRRLDGISILIACCVLFLKGEPVPSEHIA